MDSRFERDLVLRDAKHPRPKTIKEAENEREKRLRDLRIKYHRVFHETPGGEDVLRDLFSLCGMSDLEYVRGDTGQSAFNGGRRYVGIYIEKMLEPEQLMDPGVQTEALPGSPEEEIE